MRYPCTVALLLLLLRGEAFQGLGFDLALRAGRVYGVGFGVWETGTEAIWETATEAVWETGTKTVWETRTETACAA